MNERELKIGEIAQLTGRPEREIRALIQAHESLFSCRTIGPVRIFPGSAVRIVREVIELSEKGLTPEEVIREIRSAGAPEGSAADTDRTGIQLPPGALIEIRVLQETLARQERQIARLTADLEREREERREEAGRLRQTIDCLQEQVAVVAEWVDYFDLRMDEITLPALDRVRRVLGREDGPGRSG